METSLTNSFVWGVGVGSEGHGLSGSSFLDWFSIWFSGVSQSMWQWKSSCSHGIPKPPMIFATSGHGEVSWVFSGDLVKTTSLCSGALEVMLSGLLSGTGSKENHKAALL